MENVETFEHKGFEVEIFQEHDPKVTGEQMKNRDFLAEWEKVPVDERYFLVVLWFGIIFCFLGLVIAGGV